MGGGGSAAPLPSLPGLIRQSILFNEALFSMDARA
jgi:hypothetical protein